MKDPEFRKCNQAGRIFMRLTARSAGSSSGQPSSSPLEVRSATPPVKIEHIVLG
ncbi:hypothetical protein EV126DRAFT_426252 [Verticillium dahliae]|nr:hypothetical protein EV126DRAFT_426252 [Verticillium dahliae]